MTVDLFKIPRVNIPRWFTEHMWKENLRILQSSLFSSCVGIDQTLLEGIPILISNRERAVCEMLHLAPHFYDPEELMPLMEALGTLRSSEIKILLAHCSSEKVKRLIYYFGDILNHSWRIDLDNIQTPYLLKIVKKNGIYNAKYNIFIPRAYARNQENDVKF
jgi:hypothetical protein